MPTPNAPKKSEPLVYIQAMYFLERINPRDIAMKVLHMDSNMTNLGIMRLATFGALSVVNLFPLNDDKVVIWVHKGGETAGYVLHRGSGMEVGFDTGSKQVFCQYEHVQFSLVEPTGDFAMELAKRIGEDKKKPIQINP